MRFTKNSDGTYTDTETGLMWQPQDNGKKMLLKEAMKYAASLREGGFDDWRVPTDKELSGIVDRAVYDPATELPNTKSSYYWSSTVYAGSPSRAWFVLFSYGSVFSSHQTNSYYVRCVR